MAYDMGNALQADQMNQNNQIDFNKQGSFTPPNLRADNHVPLLDNMNNANHQINMNPPGMVNSNYPQNVMPNIPIGNQEVINNQKPLS